MFQDHHKEANFQVKSRGPKNSPACKETAFSGCTFEAFSSNRLFSWKFELFWQTQIPKFFLFSIVSVSWQNEEGAIKVAEEEEQALKRIAMVDKEKA